MAFHQEIAKSNMKLATAIVTLLVTFGTETQAKTVQVRTSQDADQFLSQNDSTTPFPPFQHGGLRKLQDAADDTVEFVGDGCVPFSPSDETWDSLPSGDGGSYRRSMDIKFDWLDAIQDSVFIGYSGSVHFGDPRRSITPFSGEGSTKEAESGSVSYKTIGDRFVVVWNNVFEEDSGNTLGNTFQVVLADVNSTEYDQICFCYSDMQVRYRCLVGGRVSALLSLYLMFLSCLAVGLPRLVSRNKP